MVPGIVGHACNPTAGGLKQHSQFWPNLVCILLSETRYLLFVIANMMTKNLTLWSYGKIRRDS